MTVTSNYAESSTASASVTSGSLTTAPGDLLIAMGGVSGQSAAATPFTDSFGNTWSNAGTLAGDGINAGIALYWCIAASGKAGAGHTLTFHAATSAGTPSVVFWDVTAMSATQPDVSSTGNTYAASSDSLAAGGSITTPNLTNVAASVLYVAFGCNSGNGTQTQAITGWTTPTNGKDDSVTGNPMCSAYLSVSTVAARAATYAPASSASEGASVIQATFVLAGTTTTYPAEVTILLQQRWFQQGFFTGG